jgi:hypothetical protein
VAPKLWFALLVIGALVMRAGCPAEARPASTVVYAPPVDAPVTDRFRPPATPYGPGNRGLEYAVAPGTEVRAASDGQVVFAGAVAGTFHVTIRHPDGLRTSYSYLAAVQVHIGTPVRRGDVIGRSASRLHFGLRDPDDTYLDPALLFESTTTLRARLVPGIEEGLEPLEASERASFLRLVLDQAGASAPLLLHYATELRPDVRAARVIERLAQQQAAQRGCTPADESPMVPRERHVVVLVGGLGSTAAGAAVDRVDTSALGVASGDVLRFSYNGGRVPDATDGADFQGLDSRTYAADDTQIDLEVVASRLAALLRAVAGAQPGVPIDVIAHSQGGVVARLALARAGNDGTLPREVASLATLAAPLGGADLATAAAAARAAPVARTALDAAGYSPDAPSIRQLSEVSTLTTSSADLDLPDRVARLSIAARGDLTVPSARSLDTDFPTAVVDLSGPSAHDRLPGAAATTRELALLRAGRSPSCRDPADLLVDAVAAEGASWATDVAGALLLAAAAPTG